MMAAPPTNAEELYELVCSLQREQQTTQLELKAIQRRTETLAEELRGHQGEIAAERLKRQSLVTKLETLRLELRLQDAHERGAKAAAQAAANVLQAEQVEFLALCSCPPAVEAARSNTSITAGHLPSSISSAADTTDGQSSRFLFTGEAMCSLLSALREKLSTCLAAAKTAAESRAREESMHFAAGNAVAAAGSTELLLQKSTKCGLLPTRADEEGPAESTDVAPTALMAAPPADNTPCSVPRQGSCKKHIEFAPADQFQLVTPVAAANVNRLTPRCASHSSSRAGQPVSTEAGSGSDAYASRNSRLPLAPPAAGVSVPQKGNTMKFTVRVGSRSATLLAEAAALGVKRRRTTHLTVTRDTATLSHGDTARAITPERTALFSSSPLPTSSPLSTASAAHPRLENAYGGALQAQLRDSDAFSKEIVTRGACVTHAQQDDVTPSTEPPVPAAASVPCVCERTGTGPRRTVWTWTREPAQNKTPRDE